MRDFFRRNKNNDDKEKTKIKQRVFCVTHETPLVPDSLTDFVIGLGEYHPSRGAHIATLDPYWHQMRPYAYGAAGNYAIPKAMDASGHTRLTGIFSHRKIIVRTRVGKSSAAFDYYNEVDVETAQHIPRHEIEPVAGFEFLIGFPLKCNTSVVAQYIDDHHGIDLFEYISMAVDGGILSLQEAQQFAKEQYFIAGGCELGIYPTDWLRPVIENLGLLGREFLTKRGERILAYDNYQVRAVGFLAERLGSFLLLTELRKRYPAGIPQQICGYHCAIVPPGGSYDGARV